MSSIQCFTVISGSCSGAGAVTVWDTLSSVSLSFEGLSVERVWVLLLLLARNPAECPGSSTAMGFCPCPVPGLVRAGAEGAAPEPALRLDSRHSLLGSCYLPQEVISC